MKTRRKMTMQVNKQQEQAAKRILKTVTPQKTRVERRREVIARQKRQMAEAQIDRLLCSR